MQVVTGFPYPNLNSNPNPNLSLKPNPNPKLNPVPNRNCPLSGWK